MIYKHWQNQGPLITLTFQTADGIEAGKTALRARNVQVGRVEAVELNTSLDGVIVKARIEPQASHLLREDSLFWVVRPRIDTAGITGLETLVSGAYIELRPGNNPRERNSYTGLEQPPVTPPGTPGIRLTLLSKSGESLSVGDTVTYHGHNVGQIEQAIFDTAKDALRYELFIRAPFDELVTTSTRFWNASGIDIITSTEGVRIRTSSLESLLTGGIAFD
ncbi:MAG: MlaD family protein, partial [Marinobacterium sp.]|nr:MlaD family protein [Marinobacterium sp.]